LGSNFKVGPILLNPQQAIKESMYKNALASNNLAQGVFNRKTIDNR